MAIDDKGEESMESLESVEWNVDMEAQLFYAMRGHKPVGVNRHFQMACIFEKFRNSSNQKDVTSQQIWDHLESMYDMAALHESEIVPFPNDEVDFLLPETDFGNLLKKETKKEEEKAKSIESSSDERDSSTHSGKQSNRERLKEVREADTGKKRKRQTRHGHSEHNSKPSSPASSASSTTVTKRRRNC